ncbi:MAG: SDR family oxidoreductase [Myxococcales bacterium]|nr:SDR family oxidoreductase [Myxococcales bacterium]
MSEARIAVVTGANVGIGLETARELARQGYRVLMAARNPKKGEAAVADVQASVPGAQVELLQLDLASLASVRAAAEAVTARAPQVDLLVNNAGLILSHREETEDGFEGTFGINHLGHFLFTHLLMDRLAPGVRVVNLSSEAHRMSKGLDFDDLMRTRRSYQGMPVYADSKLANILFTRELARRLEGRGVAHAVHPGVVRTGFAADGDVKGIFATLVKIAGPFMLTPAKGARTSLHAATSAEAGEVTGKYWASSKQKRPTRYGEDDAAAARLWTVSEGLVGIA